MTSMRKYAGTSFWKTDDVRDGPTKLTIEGVVIGKFDKPDIIFHDGSKLSANVNNVRILCRAHGDDDTDWVGKEVELALGEVEYQGRMQEAVIVKPISSAVKPKPKPALPGEMDDEIPF
jgi:hypothetical protein